MPVNNSWPCKVEFGDKSWAVEFSENFVDKWPAYKWTEDEGIPGCWLGSTFYTTNEYATLMVLKWSYI